MGVPNDYRKKRMLYFIVLSNSSTIFNITLELNFHAGKSYAVAKYFIQLVHCIITSKKWAVLPPFYPGVK